MSREFVDVYSHFEKMNLKGSKHITSQKERACWDGFGGGVIATGVMWRRRLRRPEVKGVLKLACASAGATGLGSSRTVLIALTMTGFGVFR